MAKFELKGSEEISEIPHKPVGKLILEAFKTFNGNNIAVTEGTSGKSLTYKQLCQLSKTLATSIRLLGVTKDDIIGLVAENSIEFIGVYLMGLFLATPVHAINPKYTKYEMENILNLSKPTVVFSTKKSHENVAKVVDKLNFVKMFICLDVDKILENVHDNDDFQVEENINIEKHVAIICNSSGTTGLPKGVMLTHEWLRMHLIYGRDPRYMDIQCGSVLPFVLPFFHLYALFFISSALYVGATTVAFDGFDPKTFLQTVEKKKVEMLVLVPTLVNFFVHSPEVAKYNLSSVKRVTTSGSVLPLEEMEALRRRMNLQKIQTCYGLTETGLVSYSENATIGKVACGRTIKIIDLENGHSLPPFQKGEICVKGYLMKGYINDIEKTKAAIDSTGFLHTGDLGYYDEDGFFYIAGRIKELIKYKSYQVSPTELEHILLKMNGVKDVSVVGKPDPRFGELPVAFVVKEDGVDLTEEKICKYLAEFVNEEKRLHGGVRFVGSIPKNVTGKILRHELVKQLLIIE